MAAHLHLIISSAEGGCSRAVRQASCTIAAAIDALAIPFNEALVREIIAAHIARGDTCSANQDSPATTNGCPFPGHSPRRRACFASGRPSGTVRAPTLSTSASWVSVTSKVPHADRRLGRTVVIEHAARAGASNRARRPTRAPRHRARPTCAASSAASQLPYIQSADERTQVIRRDLEHVERMPRTYSAKAGRSVATSRGMSKCSVPPASSAGNSDVLPRSAPTSSPCRSASRRARRVRRRAARGTSPSTRADRTRVVHDVGMRDGDALWYSREPEVNSTYASDSATCPRVGRVPG